jgi:thioredoxin 1
MKRSIVTGAIVAAALGALVVWSSGDAGESAQRNLHAVAGAEIDESASPAGIGEARTLLFFMNPNGHPCRMQDRVLSAMTDKLEGKARVNYVKTTNAADHALFRKYGIRGLPSLVLIDRGGSVIHRFAPGIQGEETILQSL